MKKALTVSLVLILAILSFGCNTTKDIHDLYTVEKTDNDLYKYAIKSIDGNLILSDEGIAKQPHFAVLDDTVVSVSMQAGTGLSTKWTETTIPKPIS